MQDLSKKTKMVTKADYKHIKFPLLLRIAVPVYSVVLGLLPAMTEGFVGGWNYENMEKQAALTAKFQEKYDSVQAKNGLEYSIDCKRNEDVIENKGRGE